MRLIRSKAGLCFTRLPGRSRKGIHISKRCSDSSHVVQGRIPLNSASKGGRVSLLRYGSSPTILLVEDDSDTRDLMATWLDAEGYRVRTASNVARRWQCYRTRSLGVELMIPVMGGAELRRHQQEMPELSPCPSFFSVRRTTLNESRESSVSRTSWRDREIVASHCHRIH
jgi:CheY-like chemotaxis protein